MVFTEEDRELLRRMFETQEHTLRRIMHMTIDVSKLQASADRAAANINKLVALVIAALASQNPAQDEAVQKQLDVIVSELDSASTSAETEEAAAAGPTGTTGATGTTGTTGTTGETGPAPAPAA